MYVLSGFGKIVVTNLLAMIYAHEKAALGGFD